MEGIEEDDCDLPAVEEFLDQLETQGSMLSTYRSPWWIWCLVSFRKLLKLGKYIVNNYLKLFLG